MDAMKIIVKSKPANKYMDDLRRPLISVRPALSQCQALFLELCLLQNVKARRESQCPSQPERAQASVTATSLAPYVAARQDNQRSPVTRARLSGVCRCRPWFSWPVRTGHMDRTRRAQRNSRILHGQGRSGDLRFCRKCLCTEFSRVLLPWSCRRRLNTYPAAYRLPLEAAAPWRSLGAEQL